MRRFQVAPTQAPPPAEWDAATDDQTGWIVGYPMVSHGIPWYWTPESCDFSQKIPF